MVDSGLSLEVDLARLMDCLGLGSEWLGVCSRLFARGPGVRRKIKRCWFQRMESERLAGQLGRDTSGQLNAHVWSCRRALPPGLSSVYKWYSHP